VRSVPQVAGQGRIQVLGSDSEGTGIGEGRIVVRRTLAGDEVNRESVLAAMGEVLQLWQQARKEYVNLKAQHRIEASRNAKKVADAHARVGLPRSARVDLERLVGLAPVKSMVEGLVASHRFAAMRREAGLSTKPISPNLVFTGNPGTGKTTVAEIVARLYKELGLVSKGHLVTAERADLVADYVGQTAGRTKKICESAKGGVLFIDEAYSLVGNRGLVDYGRESIETLLTFMEANRDDFVVIVAGYPAEMEQFIASNPGLESRFDTTVRFPDYSDTELMEILIGMLAAEDFVFGEGAKHKAYNLVRTFPRGRGFGNAREMRRLAATLKLNQAVLVADRESLTEEDMRTIAMAAVPEPALVAVQPKPADIRDFPGYL
jgi:SpoVK/Ycf46/Vps4 family AAA+-type ATPase